MSVKTTGSRRVSNQASMIDHSNGRHMAPVRVVGRVRRWLATKDWWSWDLLVGVIIASAVAIGACLYPKVRGDTAATYLYALAAAFMAMLAVVMAVLAVLIGLMSPHYRAILDAVPGGIRRAMNPYFIVTFGCAAGAVVALLSAFGWPALLWWGKVMALSLVSGMVAWLLAGTAQLLVVTFNHGSDSASVDRQIASLRDAREARMREMH